MITCHMHMDYCLTKDGKRVQTTKRRKRPQQKQPQPEKEEVGNRNEGKSKVPIVSTVSARFLIKIVCK